MMTSGRGTTKPRVLVVEDEADVRDLMLLHLGRDGFDATGVENGERALALLEKESFQLLILDWMLPGLSGLELCKKFKGRYPILMVTARADAADIVLGLEMGADDYVTKPFQISVFNARVRSLWRRANSSPSALAESTFQVGQLKLDMPSYQVTCKDQKLQLTPSEFKALSALMRNRGTILSRAKLIALIQGEGITVTERAIDTLIFGLRKNLGECASLVETVRGVGYRIHDDAGRPSS